MKKTIILGMCIFLTVAVLVTSTATDHRAQAGAGSRSEKPRGLPIVSRTSCGGHGDSLFLYP